MTAHCADLPLADPLDEGRPLPTSPIATRWGRSWGSRGAPPPLTVRGRGRSGGGAATAADLPLADFLNDRPLRGSPACRSLGRGAPPPDLPHRYALGEELGSRGAPPPLTVRGRGEVGRG